MNQCPLTKLHSLRQLNRLSGPSSVDSCHPKSVATPWDKIFNHKLCVTHRFRMAWKPEGAVHQSHLHPVSQNGAPAIM